MQQEMETAAVPWIRVAMAGRFFQTGPFIINIHLQTIFLQVQALWSMNLSHLKSTAQTTTICGGLDCSPWAGLSNSVGLLRSHEQGMNAMVCFSSTEVLTEIAGAPLMAVRLRRMKKLGTFGKSRMQRYLQWDSKLRDRETGGCQLLNFYCCFGSSTISWCVLILS